MTSLAKIAFAALLVAEAGASAASSESLDAFAARHFNAGSSSEDQQTEPGSRSGAMLISRNAIAADALSSRAAIHFNKGVRADDYQTVVPAVAQPDPALDTFAARHFNEGARTSDQQSF